MLFFSRTLFACQKLLDLKYYVIVFRSHRKIFPVDGKVENVFMETSYVSDLEADVHERASKQVFLKISQYPQESACVRPATLLKRDFKRDIFL